MIRISSRWGTTVVSLAFIALGVVIFAVSSGFPAAIGTTLGPGYLPRLLGTGLIIFAAVNLIVAWVRPDEKLEVLEPRLLVLFVVLSFAHIPVIGDFNYYWGTFLFLLLSFACLNKPAGRWRQALIQDLAGAAVSTGAIYVVFGIFLALF